MSASQPDSKPARADGRWWAALAAISLAGAVPRLIASAESLAWDELYLYAWVHDRGLWPMLKTVAAKEKTPPLGFVLAWLADQVATVPQAVRIPELIAGIATIPLIGMLGRRAFGPAAGIAAALLAAASPMLVFYSVEARSYSLTAALALGSTLFLLKAVDSGSRKAAVGYALTAAAALLSHYTAAGVLVAQAVAAFALWPNRRRLIVAAQLGPFLALLAWLPGLVDQLRISSDELGRIASVAPLTASNLGSIIGRNLLGHPLTELDRVPGTLGTWLVVAGSVIALFAAAVRLSKWVLEVGRPKPQASTVLLVAVAAGAPLLAVGVSLQPHQSMMFARNLMASLPAALVLAAALLARPPRALAVASTVLVVAGLVLGTRIELTSAQRPDARAAALAVAADWKPGDRIIELCCLTGGDGPLGTAVAINLPPGPRASLSVLSRTGDEPYVNALRSGGRVFVIGYVPAGLRSQMFFSPPRAWSDRFVLARRRLWLGMLDTVASEYRPNGKPGK